MRDQGSCAPTRAQPMPSSTRCLARSRTEAGTSSSVVFATQVASRPVGPVGSVAGRAGFPVSLTAAGVVMALLAFLVSDRLGVLGGRERTCLVCVPGLGVDVDCCSQRLSSPTSPTGCRGPLQPNAPHGAAKPAGSPEKVGGVSPCASSSRSNAAAAPGRACRRRRGNSCPPPTQPPRRSRRHQSGCSDHGYRTHSDCQPPPTWCRSSEAPANQTGSQAAADTRPEAHGPRPGSRRCGDSEQFLKARGPGRDPGAPP